MNKRMNECTNEWMNEWTNTWMNKQMNECMNENGWAKKMKKWMMFYLHSFFADQLQFWWQNWWHNSLIYKQSINLSVPRFCVTWHCSGVSLALSSSSLNLASYSAFTTEKEKCYSKVTYWNAKKYTQISEIFFNQNKISPKNI